MFELLAKVKLGDCLIEETRVFVGLADDPFERINLTRVRSNNLVNLRARTVSQLLDDVETGDEISHSCASLLTTAEPTFVLNIYGQERYV